ncbi:MAG: SET domain-containing protein [Oligoflexia bacterium]|nr:SET domain-containing protein [Oligoflexia bacterium]
MALHPSIKVGPSRIAGKGLIAVRKIPAGTIIWTYDPSDVIKYTAAQYRQFSPRYQARLRKHAYTDYSGNIIYPRGTTRYFNHSCDPNCTDANREDWAVALRDIRKGEEITYDYGLLMGRWEPALKCACGSSGCRRKIGPMNHSSNAFKNLMRRARKALQGMHKVPQPLLTSLKLPA